MKINTVSYNKGADVELDKEELKLLGNILYEWGETQTLGESMNKRFHEMSGAQSDGQSGYLPTVFGDIEQNGWCTMTVYMENGQIINSYTDRPIEHPAVLVSRTTDMIHAWGDFDVVNKRFKTYTEAYGKTGLAVIGDDLTLIDLSELVSKDMACYVIRRMSEYTASGFVTRFCDALVGADPIGWLKAEMERIPLDI